MHHTEPLSDITHTLTADQYASNVLESHHVGCANENSMSSSGRGTMLYSLRPTDQQQVLQTPQLNTDYITSTYPGYATEHRGSRHDHFQSQPQPQPQCHVEQHFSSSAPAMQHNSHNSHNSHTTTPNDGQNAHWFGSNQQEQAQQAYDANNIIRPPENKEDIEKKKATFVVVDSRSRNHTDDPDPNSYTVPLPNEIRDVESIQLISYNIPKPQFPVRECNNVLHLTNAEPTVVVDADGTETLDLHKSTSLQSVRVPEGYYGSAVTDHVSSDAEVNAFKAELVANVGDLSQDSFAAALETQLNQNTNATCIVYIEPHNNQYTLVTNFANSITSGDSCDAPFFFHPFFEGCEEFYGSTTSERVNICDESNPVYQYKKIGKKQSTYLESSMGEVIGHPRKDPELQLTGRGSNVDALDKLVGTDTRFTEQLRKGDWVYIYEHPAVRKRVHINEVISDTLCSIDCDGEGNSAPTGPAFEDARMWVGRITFPWVRNLDPDPYIAMYLDNASTLSSYSQAVDKAFFLVPGNSAFYEIHEHLPFKKFSPTRGRIDKLSLTFKNADNSLYDFKGRDHVLMFKVVHFRQNIKYGDF